MFIRKKFKIFVTSLCVLFSANAFSADLEDLIESRQAVMKLYAVNIDYLGDMIRERIPYNKKAAQDAADNLMALAKLHTYILWPQGSGLDNPQLKGKTAAKPEIWQNRADFESKLEDLRKAADKLDDVAEGGDRKAIAQQVGVTGEACKACHDDYKSKDYLY